MTKLKTDSPVSRETATVYRGRPLIVQLYPGFVVLRPKGTRQSYSIDYRAVYEAAGKIAARIAKEEKKKGKR